MALADHRANLKKVIDLSGKEFPPDEIELLTAGCFSLEDVEKLINSDDLEEAHANKVGEKVNAALIALGIDKADASIGFMEEKRVDGRFIAPATTGISTQEALLENKEAKNAALSFPKVAATSAYSNKDQSSLAIHQREAQNRRLLLQCGAMQLTQMNTGTPGMKVKGGIPLKRYTSGFDRDYVVQKMSPLGKNIDREKLFIEITGLNELAQADRQNILNELKEIQTINDLKSLISKVEDLKFSSLMPQIKVSS
jgi:hypothetical protein